MRNRIKNLVGLPVGRVRAFFAVPRLFDLRNIVALVILIGLLAAGLAGWFVVKSATMIDEFARGGYLAARLTAIKGDPYPVTVDYSFGESHSYWSIETNSDFLAQYAYRVAEFIGYEGVGDGTNIPSVMGFIPWEGEDAFVILGRASSRYAAIGLNDRYAERVIGTLDGWADGADILETLTHEALHLEAGRYTGMDGWGSDSYEAFTQAVTIEVLAGMCNYGDPVACKGFAGAMRDGVVSILRRDLNKVGLADEVFDLYADLVFRKTPEARERAAKTNRWWDDGRRGERITIIQRYGVTPLERFVLPGLHGKTFDTGTGHRAKWDDTRHLLSRWGLLAWFLDYEVAGGDDV